MAVVNVKGAAITQLDATPPTLPNSRLSRGGVRESIDVATVTNGDSIASTYRLCRVPSTARISQILLSCPAITTCAGDVGLYRTAADGGAVVDADFFGSAVSLASALSNSDVTRESAVITVDKIGQPLWQQLGLSADPGVMYDVTVTLTAAAGSGGFVGAIARFVE